MYKVDYEILSVFECFWVFSKERVLQKNDENISIENNIKNIITKSPIISDKWQMTNDKMQIFY